MVENISREDLGHGDVLVGGEELDGGKVLGGGRELRGGKEKIVITDNDVNDIVFSVVGYNKL